MLLKRMRWKACLFLLLSSQAYAELINFTHTDLCAQIFSNCSSPHCLGFNHSNITQNCMENFNHCMNSLRLDTKPPQACYQEKTAGSIFYFALYATISVFSAAIFVYPAFYVIVQLLAKHKKLPCCMSLLKTISGDASESEAMSTTTGTGTSPAASATTQPINPGQIIGSKIMGSLATSVTMLISFVTVGWIFSLWQSFTTLIYE